MSLARRNICFNIEEAEHLKWEICGWASKNLCGMIMKKLLPFFLILARLISFSKKLYYVLNRNLMSFLLHDRILKNKTIINPNSCSFHVMWSQKLSPEDTIDILCIFKETLFLCIIHTSQHYSEDQVRLFSSFKNCNDNIKGNQNYKE